MKKSLLTVGIAGLVAAVLGCGEGSQNPARITGKVTYKGQPLKAANLTFYHDEKGMYSATLDREGKYELKDAPVGQMTVVLDTELYNPDRKQQVYGEAGGGTGGRRPGSGGGTSGGNKSHVKESQKAAGERQSQAQASGGGQMSVEEKKELYVKLPSKYTEKSTTDLKFEAKSGNNTYDIDLKD
jgi:hypothetical protein